jgi:hypothetical protein
MRISEFNFTRRQLVAMLAAAAGARIRPTRATPVDPVTPQPYFAGVMRALEALAKLGGPVLAEDAQRLATLSHQGDRASVDAAESILNRYTLASVAVETDLNLRVSIGGAQRSLVEQGWRLFLIRVTNPTGRTDSFKVQTTVRSGVGAYYGRMTPGHMSWGDPGTLAPRSFLFDTVNKAPAIQSMWLMSKLEDTNPLSGVAIEYRVVQLFSRDHGQRRADFNFVVTPKVDDASAGSNGHREVEFECLPSREVALGVYDHDGQSCVASLTIKDKIDRVYPPQAMRIAPDMAFQPQVYRANGETVRLPDGEYTIVSRRGPEYLHGVQTAVIGGDQDRIDIKLERWIDPSKWGWYSSDTHIHAGGCAHYSNPTEGVSPETMIRQVRGEGLSVGDVLTWGPSWYYQKQFFTGHAESPAATLEHPELQAANNISLQPHATQKDADSTLRYDVEVSGFPSSHAGHLVLLRLRDQDYPGTKLIEDWPSWNLPILKWARTQGAVVGYAHCGSGMVVDSTDLPNYEIPPMDGVGTQEAIVDVTHGFVDFLSGCDTPPRAELNAWYHMLNCGFRLALLGETDYPCISGERVGGGRSYVRLDRRPVGDDGYESWVRELQSGHLYCGDGRSHFLEFTVNGVASGNADVKLAGAGSIKITALVAARLEPEVTPETEAIRRQKPQVDHWGWHLEQARIGNTREIAVELVVNGIAVDRTTIVADGTPQQIHFKSTLSQSSWVALRILPSGHTHPVFVSVDNKPIRASRRSAQWCRTSVDKLWEVKSRFIRESECPAAAAAFDFARKTYDTIIGECAVA